MRKKRKHLARRRRAVPAPVGLEDRGEVVELLREVTSHPETGPVLSGGDVDADWQRAESSGEEAVGGSVATPDQSVVDELGQALGVEQASDAPVLTSETIHYWHLERDAAEEEQA